MTLKEETQDALDFAELFSRWRADRLAKLVAGQPPEFWASVAEKLDSSPDETITEDELVVLVHEGEFN